MPAIRLLLLTGCRRIEIVTLRWDGVDRTAGELRLSETKTGPRRMPLTPAVKWVLERIPRIEGNPWVITGQKEGDHLKNLDAIWLRLHARAGLEDVRLHDCRHSFASRALALGEGLPAIGRMLGHRKVTTAARYAHLERDTEKASMAKIGGSIGADLLGGSERRERAARRETETAMAVLKTRTRHGVLGLRAVGLRGAGVSLGKQGLRGADPGPGARPRSG